MFLKLTLFIIVAGIVQHAGACFGGCGLGLGMMPGGFGGFGGFGGLGGLGGIYPGFGGFGGLGGYGGCLGGCGGLGGFGYGMSPLCCSPYMGMGGGFIGKRSIKWHLKASRAKERVKHRRDAKLNKIKPIKKVKIQSRLRF